ncbi:glycoside hydrolase family 25 protein [Magnetospirillum molischianum]|uniref:Lyzozyme M1 n=1 Tax=Magnetospirillum molischianum DSM 120 TaxID=1150626 RepID=H8FQY8_MAGML|nr:glycoside hydrolase family 25 protein [Magnetospirillum molischianum]CCG40776.1 Lyzozyme M1 [Magnetospirillum molischianum DSM 120]
MLTRRAVLSGLIGLAALPATAKTNALPATAKTNALADAVIDISYMTVVKDFTLARTKSHIRGVIHKASEGGDWRDPAYAKRRKQAEAAGLLWGAYHFGTHQFSGKDQALMFLATARPGPTTLMALDLELNELNPSNSMHLRQAEDFVRTIFAATGRYPLLYTSAAWASCRPMGRSERSLGGPITTRSILSNCPLWLSDYRIQPEVPSAWKGKGWHLWQYAGDTSDGGPHSAKTRAVSGIERCDRNLFRGNTAELDQFWLAHANRASKRG